MFTGIIEETGKIRYLGHNEIEIEAAKVLEGTKIGDSISINGVCETVTEIGINSFKAKISEETFTVTTFKNLKTGDIVNLERALSLNSRLGGHIVTGHVECCAGFAKIENFGEFYNLTFEIPDNYTKYVVYKGSITINGISLTVAEINDCFVKIAVIPHTYNHTNLKYLKTGDFVNIETDILGKYVEKILSASNNKSSSISMDFLAENGFV